MLSKHESEDLEFKHASGGFPGSFWDSYSAFANTEGGTIYIGIDDDGCIIGVDDPDDVQKKVVSSCRDGIAPDVMQFLSCDRKTMDGKDVIVLEAFVFAPRYDKRQYLRQVESLLYSFEWKNKE